MRNVAAMAIAGFDLDDYWRKQSDTDNDDPKRFGFVTRNWTHYRIGPEVDWTYGFDKMRFRVTFEDGTVVETHNLWLQGTVPEHLRHLFTVRAEVEELGK